MRPWVVVAVAPIGFEETAGRLPIARAWTEDAANRRRDELHDFAPADGWLEVCHRRDWRVPLARVLDLELGRLRRRRARTVGPR